MLKKITEIEELKSFYELYKKYDNLEENFDEFVYFCKKGEVLTNNNFIALFMPIENICFVFYLVKCDDKRNFSYMKLKEFMQKAFDKFKMPLVGLSKDKKKLWYFDNKFCVVNFIKTKEIKIREVR